MKTASEVVEDAIELLDERGWCQNQTITNDGRICVGEALVEAYNPSVSTNRDGRGWRSRLGLGSLAEAPVLERAASAVIIANGSRPGIGSPLDQIVYWNDAQLARTQAPFVRETMLTAAKTLRNHRPGGSRSEPRDR